MGRRRNVGETRSAGAGRPCAHPRSMLVFQCGAPPRGRCKRCGQDLLLVDEIARPPRPRDKPWRPRMLP